MSLGDKLKEERLKNEYTQEDIAKILNVARSTVSSWEVSRTYPDLSFLITLSKLYGVTVDYLIKDEEETIDNNQTIKTMGSLNQKQKYFGFGFLACFICALLIGLFFLNTANQSTKKEKVQKEPVEYIIPLTDIMDVTVKEIPYGKDNKYQVPEITANVKLREGWKEPGWVFHFDNNTGAAYIHLSQNKVYKGEPFPTNYFPKLSFVAAQYVRDTEYMDIPKKIILIDDNTADPPSTAKEQRVIWEK
ncbi:helix-turn-helix domain-containing protein [Enterococcus thailandicus]|uniref:helix-turn-helix domain-containing protein n=1 Tax=Enterococcus TaxID=1350 RepID=UPI0022E5C1F8|nr:helix-turn-helix transcriptional regulator [Enterococcus thailandicus]MDA3965985.1 helix-turn-helix transcriptional regulator [Enterococcus thailandicus]